MKLSNINDFTILIAVVVSVAWQTTAMAAPLDALPNSPHPNATFPAMEGRVSAMGATFWSFVKAAAIVLGLFLVISSLIRIRDISNKKIDGSIPGAFFALLIGGMISSVATWLFVFSKTAEDLAGVS